VVYLVGGEPQAWRIPFLPPEARYIALASNFPESAAYRVAAMASFDQRPQRFALIPGPSGKLTERFARINDWAERVRFDVEPGCGKLHWIARRAKRLRAQVHADAQGRCQMVPSQTGTLDQKEQAGQLQQVATTQLAAYQLRLMEGSCRQLPSSIGKGLYPYQWCRVERQP
jgi:hypothetical protein